MHALPPPLRALTGSFLCSTYIKKTLLCSVQIIDSSFHFSGQYSNASFLKADSWFYVGCNKKKFRRPLRVDLVCVEQKHFPRLVSLPCEQKNQWNLQRLASLPTLLTKKQNKQTWPPYKTLTIQLHMQGEHWPHTCQDTLAVQC